MLQPFHVVTRACSSYGFKFILKNCFEVGSCYVAWADPKLAILLPQCLYCGDYRYKPVCLLLSVLLFRLDVPRVLQSEQLSPEQHVLRKHTTRELAPAQGLLLEVLQEKCLG